MFQGGKRGRERQISQETQSPVTKLFQTLKEKCSDGSSETVNLMKAKKKANHTDKRSDRAEVYQQTSTGTKNKDDTSSFTSCSLKKLLASEAPRVAMALIVVVGVLSILFLLKCICCPAIFSDLTEERRDRRSDDAIIDNRKPWEASKSRLLNEFAELSSRDAKQSNLHSGDVDYPEYMLPELSSILDPIKVNEGYGSNNLREFYRKLLKTDIQIKNLKKGFTNIKHGNSLDFTDPNSPRLKRSPKIFTDPAGSHDWSATYKRSLENHDKYYSSDLWKVDKDDAIVLQDDLDAGPQPDLKSPLKKSAEKEKLATTEQKSESEYTATDKGNILNTHQPADSMAKNALKHLHFKRNELFNTLFGRERPSTQHRRLLQHDDDEDTDEGENGDYEDMTKEPWDREKRAVNPAEMNNNKQTDSVQTAILPKTTKPDNKQPKPVYSDEINYLIEAAIRMATGKLDTMENKEKYPSALINSNKEYFEDNGNYDDLVEMAQAYSDYGVLDSKKEKAEKNKALGNTYNLLAKEKPHEILEQIKRVDNILRGQRVKLKSNNETNTEKDHFLKKFRLKMFSKGITPKAKDNVLVTTAINGPTTSKITDSSRSAVTCTSWNIFTQKKVQKHKERNVMYSGHRRSLKSIEIEEATDDTTVTDSDVEQNVKNIVKLEIFENSTIVNLKENTHNIDSGSINERKSDIINKTNKTNVSVKSEDIAPKLSEGTLKRNNTSWGLGEIFDRLADYCMFLSGFDENREDKGYRFLRDIVTKLNPNYLRMKNKTKPDFFINDTRAPIETPIDSEMVDNIGHRSRVLMSFEEKTENSTVVNDLEKEDKSESYVITTNKDNTNATQENKTANSSNTDSKSAVIEANNRTVVKRSANGNVIFWNDLYDDEYGVKDPMEDDMKDKSSVKFNDLMGKDNWISNKFKTLAKNLKERRNRNMQTRKNQKLKISRNKTKTHTKRAVPVSDVSGKQMFEGLNANMKKVFHEASQAIHDSINREVRADSNQASTLMQQLVSLMSELVDMQVRAKTCIQLPDDLRSFLAWLTSPNTEERDDMSFSLNSYDAGPNRLHYPETYDLMTTNARSECLGTIHDVEDLILQYDEMSEEDKSKMSGVREYLEHQLHYLHKQLSSFNEYGSPSIYQDQPIRRRRQPNSIKKQRKPKAYRFIGYGRKHTRSTDFYDIGTEDYKSIKFVNNKGRNDYNKHDITNVEDIENSGSDFDANEKADTRKLENDLKVNLKDDYYSDLVKRNDTIFKLRK